MNRQLKIDVFISIRSCVKKCEKKVFLKPLNYNITKNVKSEFSIVTIRRVVIIFFEFGVVKKFMQIF